MGPSRLLPKHVWKDAIGAAPKPKRLHLVPSTTDNLFYCPVKSCDSFSFRSQRGCRKHVSQRHGWYYYFDEKPNVEEALPAQAIQNSALQKPKRSHTSEMPSFLKTCVLYNLFSNWLESPGGSLKSHLQSDQICSRVLKFLKFCCQDACPTWDVPLNVVDYCLGCIQLVSDYVNHLQTQWNVGFSGIIGHVNALSHLLDFRRMSDKRHENSQSFVPAEIYLQRVKKSLTKKMRSEWHVLLSLEYLSSINCWATLEDLQSVIPYHGDRFAQILINSTTRNAVLPAHDLSFCTSFIVSVLFLMIKGSRPMTFQFLTVGMVNRIDSSGMIDQTLFKTKDKYGFDSLIFSKETKEMIGGYIQCIRPRLNPTCDFLLVSRNGRQLTRLGDIFGRLVYQSIGKYIHPTRYRQIVETESAERLTVDEQNSITQDQKHTSNVAKVHYKKTKSRLVATKGKEAMNRLRDDTPSVSKLQEINEKSQSIIEHPEIHLNIEQRNGRPGPAIKGTSETKRKQKIPFSKLEDNFLKAGLKRYGKGKWKSILSDPEYTFCSARTTATLLTRAKTCKYI